MTDETDPADRERFGEAGLGEAQADDSPDDPEMVEGEAPGADPELTDVPALEPVPADEVADEAEQAAAAEAAEIGGHTRAQGLPESQRPLAEAGGGEAEGFELAEEELIESASHGDPAGHPSGDRFPVEDAESEGLAEYGEADRERVSEDTRDDH